MKTFFNTRLATHFSFCQGQNTGKKQKKEEEVNNRHSSIEINRQEIKYYKRTFFIMTLFLKLISTVIFFPRTCDLTSPSYNSP